MDEAQKETVEALAGLTLRTFNDHFVLASIKTRWLERILSGEKVGEVRKTAPRAFTAQIRDRLRGAPVVLFYETAPVGAITGGAILRSYDWVSVRHYGKDEEAETCVSREAFVAYAGMRGGAFIWHLMGATRFAAPIPLACVGIGRAPLGWRYLSGVAGYRMKAGEVFTPFRRCANCFLSNGDGDGLNCYRNGGCRAVSPNDVCEQFCTVEDFAKDCGGIP